MKISNEVKVGALAVVAILVLVLGFNFLKGKSVFKKQPVLYAKFSTLGSLEKSNYVKINGLTVGTVYNFVPTTKDVDSILVEIHLTRDIIIPNNSVAFIDGGPIGAAFINIEKGTTNTYLESGDTISTRLDPSLLSNLKTALAPTVTRLNETLDSMKIAIGSINAVFNPNTNASLQTLFARLAVGAGHLNELLNAETGALAQTLNNTNTVAANLAHNNDQITSAIRNVEITTANLANARIQETVAALEGTIGELRSAAEQVKTTVNRMATNNGTLGLLMNDRKVYDRLDRTLLAMEILLDDVRVHPKRYVNISVFGNRATPEPITSPAVKDTLPLGSQ